MMEIMLSSFKKGYGHEELLSTNSNEYWNTDDVLPHFIRLSFDRSTYVYSIELYLSYNSDESYTPNKIRLYSEGWEVKKEFNEPEGKQELMVNKEVFEVYVIVESNHAEGKDSRIRNIRVKNGPNEYLVFRRGG